MIILAKEEKGFVYFYTEDKKPSQGIKGELYNYTSDTVAVRNGEYINIYGIDGQKIATYPYDFINMTNIIGEIM